MTELFAIRFSRLLTSLIPFGGMRRRCRKLLRYHLQFPPGRDESFARASFRSSVRYVQDVPRMVSLPTSETPLVSVIIPVFNNYALTMRCLASLAEHSDNLPVEVILADDASTDETRRIQNCVEGLRVVRTPGNLRFLRNCNHAACHARGKYVLFLNNDTQVQDGWLRTLVATLEGDASIGLVGSMLLNPDLTVQECGMRMARDGVATSLGGGCPTPWRPAFRGIRDVDYVSGASIMLTMSLWNELGGFDELFAPAYYEDSDLAYRVRACGLRVVCQPASIVIHCCGASSAGGSSGQKASFEKNRLLFVRRWCVKPQGSRSGKDVSRGRPGL